MKISRLTGEVAELTITVPPLKDDPESEPENVLIVYRPGALTLEVGDRIKEVQESGFEMDVILVMLERMLVSWDLQKEDGTALGVTPEDIKTVPLAFLGQLLGAMERDVRPNLQRDETSGETSQEDQRVPSLAGTSLSGQPGTTE